jgi:hypothetical protein
LKKKKEQAEAEKADRKNNKGQLIVDAISAPSDIRYPTDISLLNEARENAESFIDFLYENYNKVFIKKPRDYPEVDRKSFLSYTKKRRPGSKVRRKALERQLGFLKRDIRYIDEVLLGIDKLEEDVPVLPIRLLSRFKTVKEVYEQQDYMYRNRVNKVDSRILSISQPHIRPIVRGKAGKAVEFGAKISLSLSNGFSFIDNLSWDSFNETKDLIPQIKKYKESISLAIVIVR